MTETTRSELRRFIGQRFAGVELSDDTDMFSLGLANSLFSMELVLFLEQLLQTQVPNEELSLDNFRTIDALVRLADRLTPANGQPPADRQPADRQPAELG